MCDANVGRFITRHNIIVKLYNIQHNKYTPSKSYISYIHIQKDFVFWNGIKETYITSVVQVYQWPSITKNSKSVFVSSRDGDFGVFLDLISF